MKNTVKKENTSIDVIIKSYGQNIRNIITSITGNRHFQDIQQEVHIKIWKNISGYKDNGKLHGWIKTITVNTCKDHLKSKHFNLEKMTDYEEENIVSIKDKRKKPEDIILESERKQVIINAIESLKPKLKEVILLYDIEELTYEEISKKINCPVGTVKSRLFNARKHLQNELTDLIQ